MFSIGTNWHGKIERFSTTLLKSQHLARQAPHAVSLARTTTSFVVAIRFCPSIGFAVPMATPGQTCQYDMTDRVVNIASMAPRSDRGPQARKALTVLLSEGEKAEIEAALVDENSERGLDLGVGSKLRELGLLWARGRRGKRHADAKKR